jgi:hypothetical protein
LELGLYTRKRGAACLAPDKLHINCIIITRFRLSEVPIASMNLSTSLGTILANQSLFLPCLFTTAPILMNIRNTCILRQTLIERNEQNISNVIASVLKSS